MAFEETIRVNIYWIQRKFYVNNPQVINSSKLINLHYFNFSIL
jgi:hypothetical protein